MKISYGADIQEVPDELEQLHTYVSHKVNSLKTQSEHIEDALSEEEIDLALPLIDKMRKTLTLIDQRLSDIEMISVGYLSTNEENKMFTTGDLVWLPQKTVLLLQNRCSHRKLKS